MTQHTPGPWKVVSDDLSEPWRQDVCTDRDNECVLVASVRVAPPVGETENNARLIAAAPELLEACKTALDWMTDSDNAPKAARDFVEAAIAKAEGQ